MKREELTQERLKELLHYDPETGVFTWKERPLESFANVIAGKRWNKRFANKKTVLSKSNRGNIIWLLGKIYLSRRLAWMYIYGKFPENGIDNIDGNKYNDSICNLRESTRTDDIHKCDNSRKNQKYMRGVSKINTKGKDGFQYCATITTNKKNIYLGGFLTEQEAHNAYVEAKRQISPEFCML